MLSVCIDCYPGFLDEMAFVGVGLFFLKNLADWRSFVTVDFGGAAPEFARKPAKETF